MTDQELKAATEAARALEYVIDKLQEADLLILKSKVMANKATLDHIRLAQYEKRALEPEDTED